MMSKSDGADVSFPRVHCDLTIREVPFLNHASCQCPFHNTASLGDGELSTNQELRRSLYHLEFLMSIWRDKSDPR